MILAWLIALSAHAEALWPVEAGQTVEAIANQLGDADLGPVIRQLNGLGPTEQPRTGQLIALPDAARTSVQQAFLVALLGAVTVAPPGGPPQPAQRLVALPVGGTVCTAPDSYALMQVATTCADDGPVGDEVVLWSETCVRVRSVGATAAGRSTVVQVLQGSLVVAEPDGEAARVSVLAGAGIATGTGGFRVHLEADEALRAEALTAQLRLLGQGTQLDLAPGQGSRVRPNGTIDPVTELLGNGPLVRPSVGEPLRRVQFRWDPTPDAFGYQVALSADPRGLVVLHRHSVTTAVYAPELLLLPVEPGEPVWWTVATVDRFGFLGVPSPRRPFGLPWQGSVPRGTP